MSIDLGMAAPQRNACAIDKRLVSESSTGDATGCVANSHGQIAAASE
jgi:hypothetical protein